MKIEYLPVDKVELDMTNPRIARILEMYDPAKITAEQIALALGAGDAQEGETYTSFQSLRESIRTHRGIIHPIVVNRVSGKMVVIEGNTRLQVYREFARDKVPGSWTKIPAVVHDDLPPLEIDAIRLQSHLVGPRPWEPYSKARYLHELRNSNHMTLDQIVDYCGGRRRQVMDYIQAYQDMENYYRPALPTTDAFDPTRFSAFVELQKQQIQAALVKAGFEKLDFARWIIGGLIHPLQRVRDLPRVLSEPKAKQVFLKEGAAEAVKVLDSQSMSADLSGITLAQLAQAIASQIAGIGLRDVKRMRADAKDPARVALEDAQIAINDLISELDEADRA